MRSYTYITLWISLSGAAIGGCNAIVGTTAGQLDPAAEEGSTASGSGGQSSGQGGQSSGQGGQGGQSTATGAGGQGGATPTVCDPGSILPCYSGPAGTDGLGACHAGVKVCDASGSAYGQCTNEVTPSPEDCSTPVDDDCNGVVNDEATAPTIVSPAAGATVAGGSVVLEWSEGAAPYQVEIAFDAAFTDPVTSIPPITTWNNTVTIDGLNGGYFYWRVRSLGGCSASPYAVSSELHVTCAPIELAADPVISQFAPTIAWNPKDHEYGVVYVRYEGGKSWLRFLRTDRLGNIVFGPTAITGPLMPDPSSGGYQNPSLTYVTSLDRWAAVYHREGADQSYATLFDDNGAVLATQQLDAGSDSEAQSIAYHPGVDRIVTSTDHGGSAWETYVQRFNPSLSSVAGEGSVNAVLSSGFPTNGAFGPMITLPGLAGVAPSALAAFEVRESISPNTLHLFVQRIDLTTGAIAWGKGVSIPNGAGKKVVASPGTDERSLASIDWNPENQNVGLIYSHGQVSGANTNVYFSVLDPKTGAVTSPKTLLNVGGPLKAFYQMPKVAWDGEEFLAVWNDGRNAAVGGEVRMSKFSGAGNLIGGGDALFALPGWRTTVPTWTGRALVGHDRVHALVSYRAATNASPNTVSMCIEPPYN